MPARTRLLAVLLCPLAAGCVGPAAKAPPELGVAGPVLAPIRHERFFRGERELFGYRPRFWPNTVTFDPDNRPYLRAGDEHQGWKNTVGVVQTLDRRGRWRRLDFTSAIRARFPKWDGTFLRSHFAEERIAFDAAGDAYMVVNGTRSSLHRNLLLHSRDRCRSWHVHELPAGWARLEMPDGHNDLDRPPVLLVHAGWQGGPLRLIAPRKESDGTLTVPKPVRLPDDGNARPLPLHSGAGNATATKRGRTHVVWLSLTPVPGRDGTPQYAATYDHATRAFSKPVLLGFGGTGKPDVHNGPAVALDSKGTLHVVFGAHHDPFHHTRSLEPNTTTAGWTKPVPIGKPQPAARSGSYTYVSLVCDRADTLHVVARYAGDGYRFCLDYLRRKAGRPWEDRGHLLIPFRAYYSCWYHKLTLDRRGRLFLSYLYYGDQYGDEHNAPGDRSGDEVAAYRRKWPAETIELRQGSRTRHGSWKGLRAHDPAILMTDDAGDTWRLALTPDFPAGLLPPHSRAPRAE